MPKVSDARLEETRRRVLDGAREAFARHGYDGATVRVLETTTGLSRGAIFHHFRDKDALFLALAEEDAEDLVATVAEHGLVEVMRRLPQRDAGWLGVQLEVAGRLRTDPAFRAEWQVRMARVTRATVERLERGQLAGSIRDDLPAETLATFLRLVHDGLVLHLATGLPDDDAAAVLSLAETAVRRTNPVREDAPDTKEQR